ncbi:N-acetylglucosamine kinase [Streptomyces sp. 8L]|uniref:N-acetylglucosamine kinase n=1 Tax=Streptomyces sp. 8L TaxID=2877242 RepID=UPI001CD25589|nr:ATPase [Streptomyces sp. 8L]MCA1223224.1 ATPase [Streptomyces sp. 8L]
METKYIVGVDAGGSKTRLRFAARDGATVKDVTHPAGDWTNEDARGKARLIAARIREVTSLPPAAVGIGAHGCDSDAECARLRAEAEAELGVPVRVVNDAFLLAEAVPEGGPCVSLVVGTGSIAVARQAAGGGSLYAGGWGWLVGDPGSAWGTVRRAVQALSETENRTGHADGDPLLPALLAASGTGSLREVVGLMQRTPARQWAGWAPAVFDAAEAGSPAGLAALRGGAADLVALVGDLLARGADARRVVAGGSVIAGRPSLATRVASGLLAAHGLPLTVFDGDPVAGAVLLARRTPVR